MELHRELIFKFYECDDKLSLNTVDEIKNKIIPNSIKIWCKQKKNRVFTGEE